MTFTEWSIGEWYLVGGFMAVMAIIVVVIVCRGGEE